MERINGETITGMALVGVAIIFIWAASMNSTWATILLADYLIFAIGIGFIVLGVVTMKRSNRLTSHPESHDSHKSRY